MASVVAAGDDRTTDEHTDDDRVTTADRLGPLRAVPVVEWAALAAAIAPILVTVVRAALVGWMPLYDAGYFAVRSRDVLTEHHPLVGAWSMGSKTVGATLNNLGPLQLDLLAPFTKIWPYWGTALGVGLTNIAAVVGVWFVARRLLGSVGVAAAMLATVCLYASMGSWNLVEARQQLALLLPFWCLLWLVVAMCTGAWWALAPAVFVASFIAQTHFSYVYQTAALAAFAIVVLAARWWRRQGQPRASVRRHLLTAAAVAVVCWAQTAWDELWGTGNLSAVLSQSGGASGSAGWSKGTSFVVDSTLLPPFWLPGHMGEYLRPAETGSDRRSVLVLGVWVLAMVLAFLVGRVRRKPALQALAATSVVALGGGLYAAQAIPDTEFGFVSYNYYWMWPIGLLMTVTLAGAALAAIRMLGPVPSRAASSRFVSLAATAVCLAVAVSVVRPANHLPETKDEAAAGQRVGEPLLSEFGSSLDEMDIDGPVVIDRSRETHTDYFPYTMLIELQRRGIEFTFPPGDDSLARFGRDRCETGSAPYRLILADGRAAARPQDGEVVLAQVDALDEREADELDALGAEFGELMRSGEVGVDIGGLRFFGEEPSPTLLKVLATPSMSARGLGRYLADWRVFDVVTVPPELEARFLRWHALEERAIFDRVAIFLAPNLVTSDYCGRLEPGERLPD